MQVRFYLSIIIPFLFGTVYLGAQSFNTYKIEPTLLEKLQTAPKDMHTVILLLEDQVDVLGTDQLMRKEQISIHDRQVRLVQELEQKAKDTQAALLEDMQSIRGIEKGSIEPYWITNAIQVSANFEAIAELSHWETLEIIEGVLPPVLFDSSEEAEWSPPIPNGAEQGLYRINAHRLWELGYTGYGKKVFIMDSGLVDDHTALRTNFWGNNVPVNQAWSGTAEPEDCGVYHGTHVAGVVVGIDRINNDTTGVAPDAKWLGGPFTLSDCQLIQNTRSSLGNLQWALNPDGNTATTDDIPDVINNSWGTSSATCLSTLRNISNTLAAAGIAVVWAAGNDGPDEKTVFGTQSLNTSLVNTFTVGNIDGRNNRIAVSSSRGPSYCEGTGSLLIKPEVVAPGEGIRSTQEDGSYGILSGTSFSAPHVAGALLLLKEAFPEVLGTDLKLALYRTAIDLGPEGEDNDYGMGVIDVFAAYEYLIDQGNTPVPPVSATDDVVLVDVQTERDIFCIGGVNAQITFENVTTSNLQSLQIDYFITGNTTRVERINWEGNLGKDKTVTFDLPTIEGLSVGRYQIVIDIFSPNGRTDQRKLNNRLRHSFEISNLDYVDGEVASMYSNAVCKDAEVVLESNSELRDGQVIRWYTSPDGKDFIAEGNKVLTPPLEENSTFYADIVTIDKLGKTGVEEGERTNYGVSDASLIFDAYQPFLLRSVKVIAEESGGRIIKLVDAEGSVIKQKVVNIQSGESRIELNFEVPKGVELQLELGAGKPLLNSTSNVRYPYEIPNLASITSSGSPQTSFQYFYFYDWEIESNHICGRTAVEVNVDNNSDANPVFFEASADTLYLKNGAEITFTDATNNVSSRVWDFGDNTTSTDNNPTHIYDNVGNYKVILSVESNNGCVNSAETTVVVLDSLMTSTYRVIEDNGIIVYPNPSSGLMTVELEKTGKINMRLFDMLGRSVQDFDTNFNEQILQLDIQHLPAGIYYLWMNLDGKQLVEKIVKE